jgi:hypothetical protein
MNYIINIFFYFVNIKYKDFGIYDNMGGSVKFENWGIIYILIKDTNDK